jgi:Rrf2 family transcriptional regulator, iron-sulfur cluster assembly transcription factor
VIAPLWQQLHDDVMQKLDAVSIDDLCRRANDEGIKSDGREKLDYTI